MHHSDPRPCAAHSDPPQNIYNASKEAAKEYGTDLAGGANIAGFLKVANAVRAQGAV